MQYAPTINRLQEVSDYFTNGDLHLGYRRLLDAALETKNSTIYENTLSFCNWYDNQQQSKTAATTELLQQVNSLLEKMEQAGIPEPVTSHTPLLKAEAVAKKYYSGAFSLAPVDMELQLSQIIGLVGENGNGKTTLLRLLYGELTADKGSVQYNVTRNNVVLKDTYSIKSALAFIPQRPNKWYGPLMDNLQFVSTHYGYKGKENFLWTEMVCARMGLRPYRQLNWNQISSGYKMRFELAKAIIKSPQIMLLDEPLANLDIFAQQIILEDLKYLAQSQTMGMGIILSSQQLYEVEKVSHQVIFLKQGVPRYQSLHQSLTATETHTENDLVLEIESTATREQIQNCFAPLGIQSISFNGGVYIIYFPASTGYHTIIKHIGETQLPVKFFRDISNSSRRFFES